MRQKTISILILLLSVFLISEARSSYVKASQFGFSFKDATIFLQKAFDSSADTIYIDNIGQWNVAPVFINQNNKTVIFEKGVLLKALSGKYDINDCVLNISANALNPNIRRNITLIGYGATIQMRKDEYTEKINGEFRHCLTIDNAENIKVFGLTFRDSGGDGIIVGNASPDNLQGIKYCKDIIIKDCRCINNKRQGLSVISVINLLVEYCIFETTSGTAPSAGIDIEPDFEEEIIYNCIIRRCLVQNNAGNGIQVYVPNVNPQRHALFVKIEECVIKNNRQNGLYIFGPGKTNGVSDIIISECKVVDNNGGMEVGNTITGNINVSQCFFRNDYKAQNYLFTLDKGYNYYSIRRNQIFGGVSFSNCSVEAGSFNIFTIKNDHLNLFRGVEGIAGKVYVIDTAIKKRFEKNSFSVDLQSVLKKEYTNRLIVKNISLDLSRKQIAFLHYTPFKTKIPTDVVIRIVRPSGETFEQPVTSNDLLIGKSEIDLEYLRRLPGLTTLEVIEWNKVIFKTTIPII